MNLIENTGIKRLLMLASAVSVVACTNTPVQTQSIVAPTPVAVVAEQSSSSASSSSSEVADAAAIPADTTPANTESASSSAPPNWVTIESTVVSMGEQDLLDRIRSGFALKDTVDERVDREVEWFATRPDYMDRTFRRAERYLYYIVSELEARKMPLELALLPVVESAFNPTALSRAKASGLWQFIPSTGKRFGLKQNNYYDGRRDIVESTRAALDYFEFLAQEFDGDWYLAIAAYNSGEMNVSRAIERNRARGLPTDFFSLELPRETEAYVPRLLAVRRIINDPKAHGLEFGTLQNQPYFVKVDVKGQIDLALAAKLADMSQEEFLAINPAFKRRITDPTGTHHLLIPVQNEQAFMERLASIPATKRTPSVFYRVRRGDTLSKIAIRYGMSVKELMSLNHLRTRTIKPGSDLLLRGVAIPATAPASNSASTESAVASTTVKSKSGASTRRYHVVADGDTVWSIARQYEVDEDDLIATNRIHRNTIKIGQKLRIPEAVSVNANPEDKPADTTTTSDSSTYIVRSGDTLYGIAAQFNVDVKQLVSWNNIESPDSLQPGQKLMVSN
jgi:membrane-bound lytic murein transglycosylase D